MSTGRVVAETIMETVVDTALTYGAGIVVGAAVTTVLGTVAAPVVLVVAVRGAIVAGINADVKVLTGKTTTEWVYQSTFRYLQTSIFRLTWKYNKYYPEYACFSDLFRLK